jgi:intracellular septation protein
MTTNPLDIDEPAISKPASAGRQTLSGLGNILIDLGPVAVFMVAFNVANRSNPDSAIFVATGVFMAATAAALLYAWLVQKRLPPMPLVSSVLVLVFGGLTFALNDATFIMVQPTILNVFYAGIIFGGLAVGKNIWKLLFGAAFKLPDRVWHTLAIRWGIFFIVLAVLNEFIRHTQTQEFWANFKFWGVMPLTFLFMAANLPITLKNVGKDDDDALDTTST